MFLSGRNGCVRLDALQQSRQRHPGGGLLCAWRQYYASRCISPSDESFFSLCRSPIWNKHSGVVANCDHTSDWVHWVHACIRIAMGDAVKICPHVPSTLSSRSVGRRWEDMILPGRQDPRNCFNPRNLWKSEWDEKLEKMECVFSLHDKMRWKWDAVYLPWGLPNIYSASLISPPLPLYLRTPTVASYLYTWRPWSTEFGHALGGRDRVNSEMHSEAVTERVWRCTCRLWLTKIGGVLGGGQFGGRGDSSWDSIHWLTCNFGNVESWVQNPPRDEKLAGSGRLLILGWCCTWCMLYLVLTHDYGMER